RFITAADMSACRSRALEKLRPFSSRLPKLAWKRLQPGQLAPAAARWTWPAFWASAPVARAPAARKAAAKAVTRFISERPQLLQARAATAAPVSSERGNVRLSGLAPAGPHPVAPELSPQASQVKRPPRRVSARSPHAGQM